MHCRILQLREFLTVVQQKKWTNLGLLAPCTSAINGKSPLKTLFVPFVAFVGLLGAAPAHARDENSAKVLFETGMREMPEGNYEKACPAFAESLRLDPLPGTAFTLAVCESRRGRVATAWERYRDFLQMVESLPNKERKKQADRVVVAKDQSVKLEKVIPTLTLSLPAGAPSNLVVTRDGVTLGEFDFGVPARVDPGEYVITIERPGFPTKKNRIVVSKGEHKTTVLEIPVPAEVAPAKPTSNRKVAGFVVGGVGLAGVIVGGATMGLAFQEKAVLDAHCGAKIGETTPNVCDQTGLQAAQSVEQWNLASTVAFVAGGIGLGLGIVLVATAPKATSNSVDAAQRRIYVGVSSAGPSNVLVGVHGAW